MYVVHVCVCACICVCTCVCVHVCVVCMHVNVIVGDGGITHLLYYCNNCVRISIYFNTVRVPAELHYCEEGSR